MLNKIRRKSRKKYQFGGKVPINMPMPKVTHGTTQDALKANVFDVEKANEEQLELNKAGGGGDIVVPQLGHAAGDAGNKEIADQLKTLNQGSADTEFDKEVPNVPKKKIGSFSDSYQGGRRRKKTKKNTRRRTRKKQGGHCSKQLKKVKVLLNRTKKNKTRKNVNKLKKQMKILTKKIKEYNHSSRKGNRRLRKNKSHIKRFKKLKIKFNRLV